MVQQPLCSMNLKEKFCGRSSPKLLPVPDVVDVGCAGEHLRPLHCVLGGSSCNGEQMSCWRSLSKVSEHISKAASYDT